MFTDFPIGKYYKLLVQEETFDFLELLKLN